MTASTHESEYRESAHGWSQHDPRPRVGAHVHVPVLVGLLVVPVLSCQQPRQQHARQHYARQHQDGTPALLSPQHGPLPCARRGPRLCVVCWLAINWV